MKKRWIFLILILIVIAVVLTIVFINLFKHEDTTEVSSQLNTYVSEGYLSDKSEEYKTVTNFLENGLYKNLTLESEKAEVKNYLDAYKAFVLEAEFVNRQMIFSKYTAVYKDNKKQILDSLSQAQQNAKNFANYITENESKWNDVGWWQANAWTNTQKMAKNIFKNTANAMTRLGDVYVSCVSSKVVNNDLTKLIFNAASDLTGKIKEKVTEDENLGANLKKYVEIYFVKAGEERILNFVYNAQAQTVVKNILEKGDGWEVQYQNFLDGNLSEVNV